MKKLSRKQKEYLIRITKYRFNTLKKHNQGIKAKKEADKTFMEKHGLKELITIPAPQYFNIVNKDTRSELLKFIAKLRTHCKKEFILVYIDFSKTLKMGAEATLYLLAELETLIYKNNNLKFKIHNSKSIIVNQVLYQTGILKLLSIKIKMDSSTFDESVKCWAYTSGSNSEVSSETKDIVKNLGQLFTNSTQSTRGWFKVITEAMTNSHHHAYLEPRFLDSPTDISLKKWWLFGKEVDGVLTVCICDLGVGIPRSLKENTQNVNPGWFSVLKNYVQELRKKYNEDSALIQAAIEIGKSRTNLPNRGKGLSQIIHELNKLPDANVSVSILSNNGGFMSKSLKLTDSILIPFNDSIHGTIITWKVHMSSNVD
jgi:hypothetical protein